MSKANKIEWSNIDGALPKPKRLHLEKDDADSLYHCPIHLCEHEGFQSQRGCRKHVNNKHSWFFYFDEKPRVDLKIAANSSKCQQNRAPRLQLLMMYRLVRDQNPALDQYLPSQLPVK